MVLKNKINDANVYSLLSWVVFLVASVLSALLNLNLFTALTVESKLFMGFMSFTIEGGKLITLTAANTVAAINTKVRSVKLGFIICLLYLFYVGLSSLSILAGVGFSQSEIYKSTAESSTAIAYIEQDIKTLTAIQKRYDEAILDTDALANTSDSLLSDLKNKKAEADRLSNQYEAERVSTQARMDSYYTQYHKGSEWVEGYPGPEYITLREIRDTASANRNQVRADSQSYQAQINDLQSGRSFSRAQENISLLKKELEETIVSLGTLTSLNTQLRDAQKIDREKQGAAVMFSLITTALGHPEWKDTFRLIMLIVASVLIELFIFVFSPAVNVERSMLRRFRKFLPNTIKVNKEKKDLNVEDLIKSFDIENSKFEYEKVLKLSAADKKRMKQMAQEMAEERTQKLVEQHEIETEKLKDEVERYSDLRISSEESYKGLLESHANEVEELRKKIIELEARKETFNETKVSPIEETTETPNETEIIQENLNPVEVEGTKELPEMEDTVIPIPVVASIPIKFSSPTELEFEPVPIKRKRKTRTAKIKKGNEPEQEIVVNEEEPITEEQQKEEERIEEHTNEMYNPEAVTSILEDLIKPVTQEEDTLEDSKKEQVFKKNYRFGMCSDKVKDKFVAYIHSLVGNNLPGGECKNNLQAAKEAFLTEKQHKVFDSRLLDMTIKGVPLISKKDDYYINNFSAEDIISFTTKIV